MNGAVQVRDECECELIWQTVASAAESEIRRFCVYLYTETGLN